MTVIVSVVVCTYNRAGLLKGCLASLGCQTAPSQSFEVIVVDNNSSDGTRDIVQEFLKYSNVRYVTESNLGLSHARNTGLAEAQAGYVAFFDDDCLAPTNWVEGIIMSIKNHPYLDGLGGPLYPFYTTPKPEWFEDHYAYLMVRSKATFLSPGQAFLGGNMVWERDLLKTIGGFRSDYGLVGDNARYFGLGEETDAFQRAWQLKPSARFLYLPELNARHWVSPTKMVLSYRWKRLFLTGFYGYQISGSRSLFSRISYLLWNAIDFLKAGVKAGLAVWRYSHWKKWCYRELSPLAINVGRIYGALGLTLPRGSWKTS